MQKGLLIIAAIITLGLVSCRQKECVCKNESGENLGDAKARNCSDLNEKIGDSYIECVER